MESVPMDVYTKAAIFDFLFYTAPLWGGAIILMLAHFANEDVTKKLERLVDKYRPAEVLVGLEVVFVRKAEQIRNLWPDKVSTQSWEDAAKDCAAAARKFAI
jgi:hypothetical protein